MKMHTSSTVMEALMPLSSPNSTLMVSFAADGKVSSFDAVESTLASFSSSAGLKSEAGFQAGVALVLKSK
jgi:hypothetical protein